MPPCFWSCLMTKGFLFLWIVPLITVEKSVIAALAWSLFAPCPFCRATITGTSNAWEINCHLPLSRDLFGSRIFPWRVRRACIRSKHYCAASLIENKNQASDVFLADQAGTDLFVRPWKYSSCYAEKVWKMKKNKRRKAGLNSTVSEIQPKGESWKSMYVGEEN